MDDIQEELPGDIRNDTGMIANVNDDRASLPSGGDEDGNLHGLESEGTAEEQEAYQYQLPDSELVKMSCQKNLEYSVEKKRALMMTLRMLNQILMRNKDIYEEEDDHVIKPGTVVWVKLSLWLGVGAYLACGWCVFQGSLCQKDVDIDKAGNRKSTVYYKGYSKPVKQLSKFFRNLPMSMRQDSEFNAKLPSIFTTSQQHGFMHLDHQAQCNRAQKYMQSERNDESAKQLGCKGVSLFAMLEYIDLSTLFLVPIAHSLLYGVVSNFVNHALRRKIGAPKKKMLSHTRRGNSSVNDLKIFAYHQTMAAPTKIWTSTETATELKIAQLAATICL
ncbi:hypothetical protein CEUSTIGMA_g3105.t1 [Chlamydomonas eustigma]|uniref:Uncharacterized protein n=1 Tax=Chlamydomonas eustigma TaxID=1157962 RepID=A0A250WXW3_9CHLO|nr:hypothetical protein CEUSTIGMA_g3105.t1 [Chlamydomonas eustigma]|eukprot:GAX75661.1 hypothetical protein CEUSTIGMA_g3105.t1 [Chlamydomonas eustigma]